MGLFSRNKKQKDLDNIVMGFLRTEASKLLGIKPNSNEYTEAMSSAAEPIQTTFLPNLNKSILEDVANTFSSISQERVNELFGEYIFLLFVRFSAISQYVAAGKVKAEEATPDILANVIHDQIKALLK
ncbi:hypothetical protein H5158_22200 [Pseudoalteromonas sp. SR45-6]|uniref:hypothetical protein n=1 Tax=Pseudoalteromonas sp. SR45-6 TaxID=2760927 RepID=UPI001600458C|nr:hypothetical protein [Pseudoalteromonas sp. SR45-6]MBB1344304.1 hypothetical protein [Pseudoalteromonas sp. SR45-6]